VPLDTAPIEHTFRAVSVVIGPGRKAFAASKHFVHKPGHLHTLEFRFQNVAQTIYVFIIFPIERAVRALEHRLQQTLRAQPIQVVGIADPPIPPEVLCILPVSLRCLKEMHGQTGTRRRHGRDPSLPRLNIQRRLCSGPRGTALLGRAAGSAPGERERRHTWALAGSRADRRKRAPRSHRAGPASRRDVAPRPGLRSVPRAPAASPPVAAVRPPPPKRPGPRRTRRRRPRQRRAGPWPGPARHRAPRPWPWMAG